MSEQQIDFSEAIKLVQEHGVREATKGKHRSRHHVVLNNGWKVEWSIENIGPLSEVTPDYEADLVMRLTKP